jgi:hypothetical protein
MVGWSIRAPALESGPEGIQSLPHNSEGNNKHYTFVSQLKKVK